jgi:hypothetical protein
MGDRMKGSDACPEPFHLERAQEIVASLHTQVIPEPPYVDTWQAFWGGEWHNVADVRKLRTRVNFDQTISLEVLEVT